MTVLVLLATIGLHSFAGGQLRPQQAPTRAVVTAQALTPTIITQPLSKPLARASLQSFSEWKTQKVQEVQARIELLKSQRDVKKTVLMQKLTVGKTEAQLSRELGLNQIENQLKADVYSLEMARDLTVSDYFAAYLTKQDHKKEVFKEVAGKMTAEEVADLMDAYANSMFSTQGAQGPAQGLENPLVK